MDECLVVAFEFVAPVDRLQRRVRKEEEVFENGQRYRMHHELERRRRLFEINICSLSYMPEMTSFGLHRCCFSSNTYVVIVNDGSSTRSIVI